MVGRQARGVSKACADESLADSPGAFMATALSSISYDMSGTGEDIARINQQNLFGGASRLKTRSILESARLSDTT